MADSNKNKKNYNWAYPEPFNKIPPPVLEKKPGQLSEEQIRQFFEEVSHIYIVCFGLVVVTYRFPLLWAQLFKASLA